MYLQEVEQALTEDECIRMQLLIRIQCDGSQQTQFKKQFENDSDDNIFQCSMTLHHLLYTADR